ncbi:hypothetical protein [Saccharothrix sp. ST-888]|nr:hypothetical protein [Saccharothrix sp. ST-888]
MPCRVLLDVGSADPLGLGLVLGAGEGGEVAAVVGVAPAAAPAVAVA